MQGGLLNEAMDQFDLLRLQLVVNMMEMQDSMIFDRFQEYQILRRGYQAFLCMAAMEYEERREQWMEEQIRDIQGDVIQVFPYQLITVFEINVVNVIEPVDFVWCDELWSLKLKKNVTELDDADDEWDVNRQFFYKESKEKEYWQAEKRCVCGVQDNKKYEIWGMQMMVIQEQLKKYGYKRLGQLNKLQEEDNVMLMGMSKDERSIWDRQKSIKSCCYCGFEVIADNNWGERYYLYFLFDGLMIRLDQYVLCCIGCKSQFHDLIKSMY